MPNMVVAAFVAFALIGFTLVALGHLRWAAGTHRLRAPFQAPTSSVEPAIVRFDQLDDLPAPVQRYFRLALTDGMPLVTRVTVQHRGTFNMSETKQQWRPFTSEQLVVTSPPQFDWDGRIRIAPGVAVHVHDAYVGGKGFLHAALLGLFSVARMSPSAELDRGELMRWFAEAAWYPTALLPSQGIQWTAVDADSANATLVDGPIELTMQFRFGADGLIESVYAASRGRTTGGQIVPTPWQGRFWNYQERDGMLIPLNGEVAWLPAGSVQPYWYGELTSMTYEFVR